MKLAGRGRGKTRVADTIALRILGGEYAPATLLPNEATLLAEFEVSRTCLREAMQMLVAKGLVRSRPKLGTFGVANALSDPRLEVYDASGIKVGDMHASRTIEGGVVGHN